MDIEQLIDPELVRKLPPFQRLMMLLGTAVVFCQGFEKVFVVVSRTAFKNPDALTLNEITSLTGASFKQPVRALLKELTRADQIDEELARRIGVLIDERNLLVHNIIVGESLVNEQMSPEEIQKQMDDISGNWSTEEKRLSVDNAALIYLCKKVIRESTVLGAELLALFLDYLERFPEASEFAKRSNLDIDNLRRELSDMSMKITSMPPLA
jgi:hypothetical protein